MKGLKRELVTAKKSRNEASASLRMALQKAAQLRIMEKEKNKSPSYAMRISLKINKVVWSMLVDGKTFAEAEINDMVGTKSFPSFPLYFLASYCPIINKVTASDFIFKTVLHEKFSLLFIKKKREKKKKNSPYSYKSLVSKYRV